LVCFVLYVAFTLLEFGPFTALGSGRMTGPQTPDQVEEIWYLAWAQHALAHGLNPTSRGRSHALVRSWGSLNDRS